MKLLTKYSLINLGVMLVIFFLSSIVLNKLTQGILINEMDNDLGGIEARVHAYVQQYDALPAGAPLDEEIVTYNPAGNHAPLRKSELLQLYSPREGKLHNFRKLVFPLRFHNIWYAVSIAKPIEGMHHISRAFTVVSLATIFAFIVVSILLNNILLRRLWKPFYAAMAIMRNFKLGHTKTLDLPVTSIAEFSFMNESLRMATQKAEQDYLLLKEFTENASHEMQTPLSVIRSKLDLLLQDINMSERQSELAGGAYAGVKKLARLNQSLLLLAKIENNQFDNGISVNMKAAVEEKIRQFTDLWKNMGITIAYKLEDCSVNINPDLLEILLNNLFSNAINHNINKGYIYIALQKTSFAISNSGTPEALDETRLFSRFYKATVNNNSNGLGLSIVRHIAKQAQLDILYKFNSGTHTFILAWP